MKIKVNNFEFQLVDEDIINPDEYFNFNDLWILHDHGFTICAIFAESLEDALEVAADEGKLDAFKIQDEDEEAIDNATYLGNYGEPYCLDSIGYVQVESPTLRFDVLLENEYKVKGYKVV